MLCCPVVCLPRIAGVVSFVLAFVLLGAADASAVIVPGKGMHGVRLGQSKATVRARLGVKPEKPECGTVFAIRMNPDGTTTFWKSRRECRYQFRRSDLVNHGLTYVTVVFSRGRVIRLKTDAPSEKTRRGIGPLSPISALRRAYRACRKADRWHVCTLGHHSKIGDRYTTFESSGTLQVTSITITKIMEIADGGYFRPDDA
jgi:hypothetical protein